jgi:hypothetical protein
MQSGRILLILFRAEEKQIVGKCDMAAGDRIAKTGTNRSKTNSERIR